MYLKHFELQELPFSLTTDTHFYVDGDSHRPTLISTLTALEMGEGYVKITGEVGSGKTLMCRKLIEQMPKKWWPVVLTSPKINPIQLIHAIALELKIRFEPGASPHFISKLVAKRLMQLKLDGRRVVLLVDEAQLLQPKTLETLRLLANLETAKEKLLQVVLVGQPELDIRLSRPEHRQLAQRIAFSSELQPLPRSAQGIRSYVVTRLVQAGHCNGELFSTMALRHIAKESNGVPRVINVLCHKALIAAMGDGSRSVKRQHALLAAKDSQGVIRSTWFQLQTAA